MSGNKVGTHDLIDLQLSLDWESSCGHHRELRHFPGFNVWTDLGLLPRHLQQSILNEPPGYRGAVAIEPGELVPDRDERLLHRVKTADFKRHYRGREIEPRVGRYYPRSFVRDLPGIVSRSVSPLRVVALDEEGLTVDTNHPLAGRSLRIGSMAHNIRPAPEERGGRGQNAIEQLLQGPGMQVRYGSEPTDFFADEPFGRTDESPDAVFYARARMIDHLDRVALEAVSNLYGELLPPGGRVLDLMASFDTHLPESHESVSTVGLGMNAEEMSANPRLSESIVRDLNEHPDLPFEEASFDAVLCTVSVEYLTLPLEVFSDVGRILKPGGLFINTFSNRWFPTKAIRLWSDLHEFERMGLVGEYFLRAGGFGAIHTRSLRGLERPEGDKYSGQLPWSDPLYAVWAHKKPD